MGIKSAKTFEEVCERIVAVFRPHDSDGCGDIYVGESPASPSIGTTQNTSTVVLAPASPTDSPDSF
jgi:hypothetical protein